MKQGWMCDKPECQEPYDILVSGQEFGFFCTRHYLAKVDNFFKSVYSKPVVNLTPTTQPLQKSGKRLSHLTLIQGGIK